MDYIKVRPTWKLLLLLILFIPYWSYADSEDEIPLLKPRNSTNNEVEPQEAPELLKPKRRTRQAFQENRMSTFQLDILALTPLGKEDFYEKRFSTFGGGVLLSVPFTKLSRNFVLYGSLGFAATLSRLTLAQGDSSFSSVYFQFPLLTKAVFQINRELGVDVFIGAVLRTTRYDSRSSADGGFQKTDSGEFLQPEAGVGFRYLISSGWGVKLNVSYLFAALGLSLDL